MWKLIMAVALIAFLLHLGLTGSASLVPAGNGIGWQGHIQVTQNHP